MTDTELQVAQFVLPKHGFGVTNDTQEARILRSFKEDLPQHHVSVPFVQNRVLLTVICAVVSNGILWQ